jgi:O-antigen/teichoic acid export membrane protein
MSMPSVVQVPLNRRERFVKNVLWSWMGAILSIITGLVLSPYIIRKLGNEGYGVWSLAFSFLQYYWLLDLGFRSATLKYSAHYRATGESEKVNEVVNTGLAYSGSIAMLLIGVTLCAAPYAHNFFQVSPAYRGVFTVLIRIVGCAWAVGAVFSLLSGAVEGFQRFDLTSRVWILTTALRTAGLMLVLWLGFGLKAMAGVAIAALAIGYFYNYRNLREAFPALRISFSAVTFPMFRRMLGYGVHTSVATASMQALNEAAPLLLGHFLPTAFVGYFALPLGLLQSAVDLVCKVGLVSGSNAAEMQVQGEHDAVYRMGVYVNRYCYTLFAPIALALSFYGTESLRIWLNPEFARHSGPILPILAVGATWGIAAQFNSSAILYGLAKHRDYAYSLLGEAILNAVGLWLVLPRYGIAGAAWVTAILMVLNRGLFTSWLFCRGVNRGMAAYLQGVYLRPTLAAIPVFSGAWWVKIHWIAGKNWIEVLAGMGLVAAFYYLTAFFFCLEGEHRSMLCERIRRRFEAA